MRRERERDAERASRKARERERLLTELADANIERKDDYTKDRWVGRRRAGAPVELGLTLNLADDGPIVACGGHGGMQGALATTP